MAKYTRLTQIGLDQITFARNRGMFIDVIYYVPVWDQNLQDDIDNDISIDVDNYTDANDLYPQGDIYWNLTVNQWANVSTYFNGVPNGLNAPVDLSKPQPLNLFSGVSYSTVLDDFEEPEFGIFGFTVRVPNGYITMNKIGLYGVLRDESGVISSDPFLFAQGIIDGEAPTIYSTTIGGDVQPIEYEGRFKISFSNASIQFQDVLFNTISEYWVRLAGVDGVYGLQYDGQIYIGNTLGIEDTSTVVYPRLEDVGVAKVLISTYDQVNKDNPVEEALLPQLALQKVVYSGGSSLYSERRRATFRVTDDGDLELDLYGGCRTNDDYYFVPSTDGTLSLGNSSRRWGRGYFKDVLEIVNGDYDDVENQEYTSEFYIRMSANPWVASLGRKTGYVWFNNTSLRIGPHYNESDVSNDSLVKKNNYYYYYGNISNDIYNFTNWDGDTWTMVSDLGIRSTQDTFIYTIPGDTISENELISGQTASGDFTPNTWSSPEQLLKEVKGLIAYGWRQREDVNLIKTIAGIRNPVVSDPFYNSSYSNTIYDNLMSRTKSDTLRSANSDNTSSMYTLDFWVDLRTFLIGDSNIPALGSKQNVYILSTKNIWTNGDINPMIDGIWDLGHYDYQFRNLYVNQIVGGQNENYTDSQGNLIRFLKVGSHLFPATTGLTIGRVPSELQNTTAYGNDRPKWQEINADYIGGGVEDSIDVGWFTTITSSNVYLTGQLEVGSMIVDASGMTGDIDFVGTSQTNPIHVGYFENLYVNTMITDEIIQDW